MKRLTKEELSERIADFVKNPKCFRDPTDVRKDIECFTQKYPMEKLQYLDLEDYLWYTGTDKSTFCYSVQLKVPNSSMKTARPDFYGIYKNGNTYKYSKKIEKLGFSSPEKAYEWQITQIVNLLESGKNNDLKKLESNPVNSMVKCKLLSIYFPDSYLPMNTKGYIENVLNALDIPYNNSESAVLLSERLMRWKENTPIVCDWDNYSFMAFCDVNFKRKGYEKSNKTPSSLFPRKISYKSKLISDDEKQHIQQAFEIQDITDTERQVLAKARIGQSGFRSGLLWKYNGKCALCGMSCEELLIASHIKEWAVTEQNERLDIENGLLLCTLHDSLFDKHLISFKDNGEILISKRLNQVNRMLCNVDEGQRIELSSKNAEYMQWHRQIFFENTF